jgi:hypothetical protein
VPKTLAPGMVSSVPFPLNGQEPQVFPNGDIVSYLIGRIDYVDEFKVPHWMKFCFYVGNARGEIWNCQEGNDEDNNPEIPPTGGPNNMSLLSNPILQILIGAIVSFGGSVCANYIFINRRAKDIEVQRAYNRLVDYIVRIDTPLDPTGLLPLPIAERCDDLRFALRLKNKAFDPKALVQEAIQQAVELRAGIAQKNAGTTKPQ